MEHNLFNTSSPVATLNPNATPSATHHPQIGQNNGYLGPPEKSEEQGTKTED